jgi:hypothetical protein
MPISVTCPGCLSRFTVSDKYAGKKGPCPKCKKDLIVPDKSQEVVIHAPEIGPKDSKGVSILKPLKRAEFKLSKTEIIIGSIVAVLAIGLAIFARVGFKEPPWILSAIGVLALAFPLAWVGYSFFHDDELEEYSGKERTSRVGICALIFATTWGLYWFLAYYMGNKTLADVDAIQFAIFLVVMFAAGTVGSLAAMELDFGQALLHYSMYFAVTILLALSAGVQLAEPMSSGPGKSQYPTNPQINMQSKPPAAPNKPK